MPLAFASLLGGLTTLIGTPPNIIISGFRAQASGQAFGMFDFLPVGLAVAVAGLIFLALAGRFLVPVRGRAAEPGMAFAVKGYVAEAEVPADAAVIGKTVLELEEMASNDVTIAAIIQRDQRRLVPAGYERIDAGDILVLRGDADSLNSLIEPAGLKLGGSDAIEREDLQSDDIELVEAVVSPGSWIIGRTPTSLRLRTVFGLNLLAIARQGHRIDERLGHVAIRSGDVMLLQGPRVDLSRMLADLGLLPLAERSLDLGRRQRLAVAAAIFAAAIVLILSEALPAHIAFTAAAASFVVTDIVKTSEIYAAIDWPVVVLLGALFPVATALDTSGATTLMAESILQLTEAHGPVLTLVVLLIATMFISDLINNNATALLMAPIAMTLATRLGVSADPFLMAVALGASCAFLTPIGHQSNALVMEPGGYRFGDYWRVGLPLEFIIVLVTVPMLLAVWPM
jgi:di/tricarboxylate transporter